MITQDAYNRVFRVNKKAQVIKINYWHEIHSIVIVIHGLTLEPLK